MIIGKIYKVALRHLISSAVSPRYEFCEFEVVDVSNNKVYIKFVQPFGLAKTFGQMTCFFDRRDIEPYIVEVVS